MKSPLFNSLESVILILNLIVAANAFANPKLYDQEETKKILLSLVENPPIPTYKIEGEYPSKAHKAFLDFYFDKILPTEIEVQRQVFKVYAYSLLMDAGAYKDKEELGQWQKAYNETMATLNELDVSEEWTETLKQAVELAEGLTGNLVEELRENLKERELTAFPPAMKAKLDELSALNNEFDLALSSVPANANLAEHLKAVRRPSHKP